MDQGDELPASQNSPPRAAQATPYELRGLTLDNVPERQTFSSSQITNSDVPPILQREPPQVIVDELERSFEIPETPTNRKRTASFSDTSIPVNEKRVKDSLWNDKTGSWRRAVLDAHFDFRDDDPEYPEIKRQAIYLGFGQGEVHDWYRKQRKAERVPASRTIENKADCQERFCEAILNAESAYRGYNLTYVQLKKQVVHIRHENVNLDVVYEWYRQKRLKQVKQGLIPSNLAIQSGQDAQGSYSDIDKDLGGLLIKFGHCQTLDRLQSQAKTFDRDLKTVHDWYYQKFEEHFPGRCTEIDDNMLDDQVPPDSDTKSNGDIAETVTGDSSSMTEVSTQHRSRQSAPSVHSTATSAGVLGQGKPYPCSYTKDGNPCEIISNSFSSWKTHELTHWPEVNYVCLLCDIIPRLDVPDEPYDPDNFDFIRRFGCRHCPNTCFKTLEEAKKHVLMAAEEYALKNSGEHVQNNCVAQKQPWTYAWKTIHQQKHHFQNHHQKDFVLRDCFVKEFPHNFEKERETWSFRVLSDWPKSCTWPGCQTSGFGSREERTNHYRDKHLPRSRKTPKSKDVSVPRDMAIAPS